MPSAEITPITLSEVLADERLSSRCRRLFAHNHCFGIGAHRARPRGRRPHNVGTAYRHRRRCRPASRGLGRTRARRRRCRAEPGAVGGFRLRGLCQERYTSDIGYREGPGRRMTVFLDIFTAAAVSAGAFFFFFGGIGLLRFSRTLLRLLALSKSDTLWLVLVIFFLFRGA